MRLVASVGILATLTVSKVNGFAFHLPATTSPSYASLRSKEVAVYAVGGERIKAVGGGIPFIPPGDLGLFDPNEEGKLSGTNNLQERISSGADYDYSKSSYLHPAESLPTQPAQHFLEHLDANGDLPLNFAKPSSPTTATLLGRARIIQQDAPGDIQHIIMRLPPNFHYVEGQSLSVIPPGVDAKSGKPHKPRLYSIASTRYGDLLDGNTVSLCVRRAQYYDPITKLEDPSKKGVCSNFLCDAQPGTQISVAGPVGKTMLLPKQNDADIIMVATGTGIAPFRGFMHRLFMEQTVANHMFTGKVWLILGVPVTGGLLYQEEFNAMMKNAGPNQLKIDYAISREQTNKIDGGKRYVQHVIAENANEFFNRMNNGATVYFCGLKGMMPPVLETLESVANMQGDGADFNEKMKEWKKNHQWHVEVY